MISLYIPVHEPVIASQGALSSIRFYQIQNRKSPAAQGIVGREGIFIEDRNLQFLTTDEMGENLEVTTAVGNISRSANIESISTGFHLPLRPVISMIVSTGPLDRFNWVLIIYTYTHMYVYIYIHVCVCICIVY